MKPILLPTELPGGRDALADYLIRLHRRLAIWRVAAITSASAFVVGMALRHPEVFLFVVCLLLLLVLMAGGLLYQTHQGDEEMQIGNTNRQPGHRHE